MILTIKKFNGRLPNTTIGDSTILYLKHHIMHQYLGEEIPNLSLFKIMMFSIIMNVIITTMIRF